MKIQIDNLKYGLKFVGKAVGKNSTLPVLSHVLFENNGNHLTLKASDLGVSACISVGCVPEERFSTTIPYAELVNLIGIRDGVLNLNHNEEKNTVTLSGTKEQGKKWTGTLKCFPAGDFPLMDDSISKTAVTIPVTDEFIESLNKVEFCHDMTGAHEVLTGVFMKENGVLAATDGFKLAVFEFNSGLDGDSNLVMQSSVLQWVNEMSKQGELTLKYDKNFVLLVGDGAWVKFQAINAKYPDYEPIIPTNLHDPVIVNTVEISQAVRMSSVYDGSVKLTWDDVLIVEAKNTDGMGDYVENLEANAGNDPMVVRLNSQYLSDVLNHVTTKEVEFYNDDPYNPFVVKEHGKYNGQWIIMPMNMRDE